MAPKLDFGRARLLRTSFSVLFVWTRNFFLKMPSNVEIKAKVHDLEKLKVKAKLLSEEEGNFAYYLS